MVSRDFSSHPATRHGLADAIRQLAEDPQTRHRMGRAGRARYTRDFTIETAADRLLDGLARVHRVELERGNRGSRSIPATAGSVVRLAVRAPAGGTIRANGIDIAIAPAGTDPRRIERVQLPSCASGSIDVEVIEGEVDVLSAILVSRS